MASLVYVLDHGPEVLKKERKKEKKNFQIDFQNSLINNERKKRRN